jgi:hypothetical protein
MASIVHPSDALSSRGNKAILVRPRTVRWKVQRHRRYAPRRAHAFLGRR